MRVVIYSSGTGLVSVIIDSPSKMLATFFSPTETKTLSIDEIHSLNIYPLYYQLDGDWETFRYEMRKRFRVYIPKNFLTESGRRVAVARKVPANAGTPLLSVNRDEATQ